MMTSHSCLRPDAVVAIAALLISVPAFAAGYADAVNADKSLAYYRFNDSTQRANVNLNSGSFKIGGGIPAPGNGAMDQVHVEVGSVARRPHRRG